MDSPTTSYYLSYPTPTCSPLIHTPSILYVMTQLPWLLAGHGCSGIVCVHPIESGMLHSNYKRGMIWCLTLLLPWENALLFRDDKDE
jgi:hypothetical protein